MLHASGRINGKVLWANLHLLFWLSLMPFVTAWMGENYHATAPVFVYGAVLLLAAIAYVVLQWQLVKSDPKTADRLREALGKDRKGKVSVAEGVQSAPAVVDLGRKHKVELPICEAVNAVLTGDMDVARAIEALLSRPLKSERA